MTQRHSYPLDQASIEKIHPGIWRCRLGTPEPLTPTSVYRYEPNEPGLRDLPGVECCSTPMYSITGQQTNRGYRVTLPLEADEQVYGLGLQLYSLNQRGKKKTLRVNSDPSADTRDTHAPVPFYVTTNGYGVLIDTLRYITVYIGSTTKHAASQKALDSPDQPTAALGAEELYNSRAKGNSHEVIIEIPNAQGVELFFFGGPDMTNAVQRYNLFAGGGCLPPMWGLGVWYRCKSDFNESGALDMAKKLRDGNIPCDVLGLEPGWQSHAYSCSYVWSDKFPKPKEFLDKLTQMNFHANLWTHAFIHPSSPLHEPLNPKAGNYLVWGGLVPDLADADARKIYAEFHRKNHVDQGASGYKMDECDNSDFIRSPWSFPEISSFPSGLDGEQMHSALGRLYQQTIQNIFDGKEQRTYGEVRSSHALASTLPYVLYSDLYDHKSFIRAVASSGFSGLLWGPQVRHAESAEDLIRRIQSAVFSPLTQVNAWYIKNPPWEQWIRNENNADRLHKDREHVTDICKQMFELRMRFLPYLYSAFVEYYRTGLPPFRALVMEDPEDPNLHNIDNAYMMGDRVLVAPVVAGQNKRDIYLPKGSWRDFWTGDLYEGGTTHHLQVPLEQIPVFVKDNSILPLAQPAKNAYDPALRRLTVNVYGTGERGITLYEDDEETYAYRQGAINNVEISWDNTKQSGSLARSGDVKGNSYEVIAWNH